MTDDTQIVVDIVVQQDALGAAEVLATKLGDSISLHEAIERVGADPQMVNRAARQVGYGEIVEEDLTLDEVPPPNENGQVYKIGEITFNDDGSIVGSDFSEDVRGYRFLNKDEEDDSGMDNAVSIGISEVGSDASDGE